MCSDLLCDFLSLYYPQLKIHRIDSLSNHINYYISNLNTVASEVKASDCIDFISGKFDAKKYIKGTGLQVADVPDVIDLPLVLSSHQIERGIDPKNVVYSDLYPGIHYAVFITGEDEKLGAWKSAQRMNYVRDRWRLTLPEGVTKSAIKELTGFFQEGKNVSVDKLRWADGNNNHIPFGTSRLGL